MEADKMESVWHETTAQMEYEGKNLDLIYPSPLQMWAALSHILHPQESFRRFETIKPIRYVVDVGANVGGTAMLYARSFPNARILALEPVEVNYRCLVHNIKAYPNIICKKIGVHDKKGVLRFSMPLASQRPDIAVRWGNSGLFSVLGEDSDNSEEVEVDTLDNIAGVPVDYLKIDTEGWEMHVLNGAARIISEDRPIIQLEVREANMSLAGTTLDLFREFFEDNKYTTRGEYGGDVIMVPNELDIGGWTQ